MYANSRGITTAQTGVHEKLRELLLRHRDTEFRKPVAPWNAQAFGEAMDDWDGRSPVLLDSGCGVGWSTLKLAREYPDHYVIGVDQSELRLTRGKPEDVPPNARFVRADLVDFWRLLAAEKIRLARHFILYPNPWPKIGHLARRWHGHPVFPEMLKLGGVLESRSNWKIYIEEMAFAIEFLTGRTSVVNPWVASEPLTPFERKYRDSGQDLHRLVVEL